MSFSKSTCMYGYSLWELNWSKKEICFGIMGSDKGGAEIACPREDQNGDTACFNFHLKIGGG